MMTLAWMMMVLALQGVSPFRVLEKGDQSNVDDLRRVAVRTAADWDILWRRHSPTATNRASISNAIWSSAYS